MKKEDDLKRMRHRHNTHLRLLTGDIYVPADAITDLAQMGIMSLNAQVAPGVK